MSARTRFHRLLLDTNVLLDFMIEKRPESGYAVDIFRLCANGAAKGMVGAASLKDIYYISQKYLGEQAARNFVRAFIAAFDVAPVDKALCATAVDSDEPDFEDGLVRAAAEDNSADFIISRDTKAYGRSKVRALTPREYVELFGA